MAPGDGYIWTPGYWSWNVDDSAYYWVPGTWVLAPNVGDLWTPGYWGFENQGYLWHIGYWGPRVGFYGGLNYGYGYNGNGYQGGRWERGQFSYNRAISHVDANVVHHVYGSALARQDFRAYPSFNGGRAGAPQRPTRDQRDFQTQPHSGPNPDQVQHEHNAVALPTQRATGSHGVPQVAATPRPSAFTMPGVEPIRAPQRQMAPGRQLPQRQEQPRQEAQRQEPQHQEGQH